MPSIKGFKSDACCHVFYSILFLHWMPSALQLRHWLNLHRGLCAAARVSFVSVRSWGLWSREGWEDWEPSLSAKHQDEGHASLCDGTCHSQLWRFACRDARVKHTVLPGAHWPFGEGALHSCLSWSCSCGQYLTNSEGNAESGLCCS